jgi:hypothetical protein
VCLPISSTYTATFDITNTTTNNATNEIANTTTDSITNIHSNSSADLWPNSRSLCATDIVNSEPHCSSYSTISKPKPTYKFDADCTTIIDSYCSVSVTERTSNAAADNCADCITHEFSDFES